MPVIKYIYQSWDPANKDKRINIYAEQDNPPEIPFGWSYKFIGHIESESSANIEEFYKGESNAT